MSDVLIDKDTMEDIGDSIRSKLGVQTTYLPSEMPNAIMSISGGGNEMELTKAEYDALSEAEKTNGTTYYITDAQSWTSKEVQPVIYSTDEREIGVWTDGKPLYQKSYLNISVSKNSWGNSIVVPTDIQIVEIFGYYDTFNSGNYVASFDANSCWESSSAHFLSYFNNNGHDISFHWNYGGATTANATITIRYTKTTDQAGSGIYTPQGQLAVHYSTEEHVIGTWIDGKTLYERVIIDSRSGGFSTGEYEIYSDASTYHLIPNGLQGMLYNSAGSHYPVPWIGNNNSTSLHKNASGKIVLTVRNDTYNNYILEVIIRYTKTTD